MKLEKLRVIDDSNVPSRAKIKDALVEIPDDVLLKIISDYNKENNLAPIYKATEENVNKLKEEGRDVPLNAEDNFAYLTPNSYGGTEGFNNLEEKVNYDTELVPFVEANFTTYQNDIPVHNAGENHLPEQEEVEIQDDEKDGVLDEEWLKKNWTKGKVSLVSRYNNILKIAEKIKNEDFELYKKVLGIAKKYYADPDVYTYNLAKTNLFKVFKENVSEKANEKFTEEEKSKLKIKAKEKYNVRYGKNIEKYEDLPDVWKKKLTPLIESGRIETFKKALSDLVDTESEKLEKIGKNADTLLKKFAEIYGFDFLKDSIKKFAAKEEIKNTEEFLDCFEATLEAFKDGKISFETALAYFKRIKDTPSFYLKACSDWYEPFKSESEKEKEADEQEERYRETDLETESGNRDVDAIKKEIQDLAKEINASGKEEWIKYWQEWLEKYKKSYKKGERDLDSYLSQVLYLAKYVVGKIKGKSFAEENQLSESSNQKKEEIDLINKISSRLQNVGVAQEGFDSYYKDIDDLKINERIKCLKKILVILVNDSDNQVISKLSALSEEKVIKLFEGLTLKNKKFEQITKELQGA